jgi:hypothetical protein
MEDNQVYYDISRDGFRLWWFPVVFCLFGFYPFLLYYWKANLVPKTLAPTDTLYLILGFIFIVSGLFFSIYMWQQFEHSCKALKNGNCKIVEGSVTEHRITSTGNRESESFIVADKQFSYADNIVVVGFNRTPKHGGKIKNDMNLKVFYLEDRIIRIEIRTSN